MSYGYWLLKRLTPLAMGALLSLNVHAGLFGLGGDSWKEEVLLHDGRTLIIERSQTYGGRGEIGQASPVKTHSLRFTMPQSGRTLTWTSEYGEELGRTNFNVLAVHIQDDTPYLVVEPNLCLAYNKWGRPNPPYIIFKHDGRAWQRLDMADLPKAFEKINLIVNNGRLEHIKKASQGKGYVSAQEIAGFNRSLTQPQYKSILREVMMNNSQGCRVEFSNGKGAWLSADWFEDRKDLEACLKVCQMNDFSGEKCPCYQYFKGN